MLQTTDDRQTDDKRMMTYSEHERELTFANKVTIILEMTQPISALQVQGSVGRQCLSLVSHNTRSQSQVAPER